MARTGQIIPEYSYPHQKTYINDNTVRETSVGDQEYELKCMNVFVSPRGRDNQFIEKNHIQVIYQNMVHLIWSYTVNQDICLISH